MQYLGDDTISFAQRLSWKVDGQQIIIPPNQDNQIESTVIRENISLPRKHLKHCFIGSKLIKTVLPELSKIVTHAAKSTAVVHM